MARVIDLKKKKEEVEVPQELVEVPKPVPPLSTTLRWSAPAAYRRTGTRAPYVFAALLAIVAILIAIFQRDAITTALFALMAVMVVVHVRKPVASVEIEINPLAIKLVTKSYPHEQ